MGHLTGVTRQTQLQTVEEELTGRSQIREHVGKDEVITA